MLRCLADHGLAGALDEPAEERPGRMVVQGQHPAGQHQGPGRRIDEQVLALADMLLPAGPPDLVLDQLVGGRRVGDTQQGLRHAHQRDAFLGRQAEAVEEGVETAERATAASHAADQLGRTGLDAPAGVVGNARLTDQGFHGHPFIRQVGVVDGGAKPIANRQRVIEEAHGHGPPADCPLVIPARR